MRIISQGGHADLPYERTHLCSNTENVMARCDGKEYLMGSYATHEKAIKAMEMCRNRYAWCKTRNNGMNSLTMAMSFRRTDEIEQLLETFAEKNIFQFPADEEVDV